LITGVETAADLRQPRFGDFAGEFFDVHNDCGVARFDFLPLPDRLRTTIAPAVPEGTKIDLLVFGKKRRVTVGALGMSLTVRAITD
jgi:hypothetical protein